MVYAWGFNKDNCLCTNFPGERGHFDKVLWQPAKMNLPEGFIVDGKEADIGF